MENECFYVGEYKIVYRRPSKEAIKYGISPYHRAFSLYKNGELLLCEDEVYPFCHYRPFETIDVDKAYDLFKNLEVDEEDEDKYLEAENQVYEYFQI